MNKWIGIGRLTADPMVSVSNTQKGEQMTIARYNLAIDRPGKDAGADFISCVAFGKNGEFAEKYLAKGVKIAVEGRIQTGSYTNKEGNKVYTTDIVVDRHEFCESKGQTNSQAKPEPQADDFMNVPDDLSGDDLPFN